MSGILLVELQVPVQLMNAIAGGLTLLSTFSANITFSKGINKNNFFMSSVSFQSGLCGLYKKLVFEEEGKLCQWDCG